MTELICKHCKFNFLHLGNPVTHLGGDDYDSANPRGTRGSWIEIPCECEGCHKITTVNVSFHKGQIFVDYFPNATINFEDISRKEPKK